MATASPKFGGIYKGGFRPAQVGVKQASTFTGFCQHHDNAIFKDVEDVALGPSNRQSTLLGYRAVCLELYKKQSSIRLERDFRKLDRGLSRRDQESIQTYADIFFLGTRLAIRDFEIQKTIYEDALQTEPKSVTGLHILFEQPAPFLATVAVQPDCDAQGTKFQTVETANPKPLDVISFSLISTEEGTHAFFSWPRSNLASEDLANSILDTPRDRLSALIGRFAFEYTENLYMSPSWWRDLSESNKKWVERRIVSELALRMRQTV